MITVEFAGLADRWAGAGRVYNVRAWYRVVDENTYANVRRQAARAVRKELGPDAVGMLEFVSEDMDTYNSPHINTLMRYRVLSPEEAAERRELRSRLYSSCDRCGAEKPDQVVRVRSSGTDEALCFGCWNPIRSDCRVLHYLTHRGRIKF